MNPFNWSPLRPGDWFVLLQTSKLRTKRRYRLVFRIKPTGLAIEGSIKAQPDTIERASRYLALRFCPEREALQG